MAALEIKVVGVSAVFVIKYDTWERVLLVAVNCVIAKSMASNCIISDRASVLLIKEMFDNSKCINSTHGV